MEGLKPCPYCGGEVDMVKLVKYHGEADIPYRISCKNCRMLVARGFKFDKESKRDGDERIKQYNDILKERMKPITLDRKNNRDGNGKRHPFHGYNDFGG